MKIKNKKSHNKGRKLQKQLTVILILVSIIVIVFIIYKLKKNKSRISTQAESTTNKINNINKEPEIETIPNRIAIEENSRTVNRAINQFIETISLIKSNLYKNSDLEFSINFDNFANKKIEKINENVKLVNKRYIEFSKIEHNGSQVTSYYQTIISYFRILYQINLVLENSEIKKYLENENNNEITPTEIKFIIQYYFINKIIKFFSFITKSFFYTIQDLALERMENNRFVLLSSILNTYSEDIYKNLLKNGNYELYIGINEGSIDFKYLLTSLQEFKKLLIFNFLILYLNIFEIDNKMNVVGLYTVFKNEIEKIYYRKGMDVNKGILNGKYPYSIIDPCKNIFINLYKIETSNKNVFYENFDEYNLQCKEYVYELLNY